MNLNDISILRLKNQQLSCSGLKSVKEIAGWMGALQAQDFNMSKWAFGIRMKDSTEATINRAIDSGDIIRTHLLRPTWHFVSSDDIFWIMELTAPRIRAAMKFRDKALGLTETVFRKSNSVIQKSLRNGDHLTREELVSELKRAGIETSGNRASHLLFRAESNGIICSGRLKERKLTYTLLSEWVQKTGTFHHEKALKELSKRYFTSHGPATLPDFIWWSGLSSKDAKLALELSKPDLSVEIIGNQSYWFADYPDNAGSENTEVYLLPAYDEFIISYRDRTASIDLSNQKSCL